MKWIRETEDCITFKSHTYWSEDRRFEIILGTFNEVTSYNKWTMFDHNITDKDECYKNRHSRPTLRQCKEVAEWIAANEKILLQK